MKGFANAQLLVTPKQLSDMIAGAGAKRPLVLDLRPPDAYAQGHIPGAIHLDLWGVSLIDTDPAPLQAFMWMIEHVLAVHGVDTSRPIVVYDDTSGVRAARAFWFLEYFGHPAVRLLDGGFTGWVSAGYDVTRDAFPAQQTEWTGGRQAHALATYREVRHALGRADTVILDTRSDGEYAGTLVRARRGGAIPGAVHIEWTRTLSQSGEFKSAEELRRMYEDAGVTPDREVITYCQGGYRAAHSYVALRLLGYPRVRMYIGSWKEWGDRQELPVEIPKAN
jgi:thiosulfate/3-mercaptopyruvate sulfurtransferase